MHIEIRGPEHLMESLRLNLQDLLEKAGYVQGPKVDTRESGLLITFTNNGTIITIQVTEETETAQSFLRVECEQERPEIEELWDLMLIQYGKDCFDRLLSFAINKEKVKQGLK